MLIPTVLALIQFFVVNFPNVDWYPYWYLGNPFHFLIGPVVPLLVLLLVKLFSFSVLSGYIIVWIGSLIFSLIGIYYFIFSLTKQKRTGLLAASFFLVLPSYWYVMQFQSGLNHIGFVFLPYIGILYKKFLEKKTPVSVILLVIMMSLLLLINVSLLITVGILLSTLFIAYFPKERREEVIVKTIFLLLLAIGIATLWYTPSFWLILLANPSLGGVPLFHIFTLLVQDALTFLPAVLAFLLLKWRQYKPQPFSLFALLFFACLVFLTLSRFLSAPDFVMDWTGFGVEMQFGLAILLALGFEKVWQTSLAKLFCVIIIVSAALLSFFSMQKSFLLQKQSLYQQQITTLLQKNSQAINRLFTSGTPVFWLDALLPIQQVRGGSDNTSLNPVWAMAAYQIREGEGADVTKDWLSLLGVSTVLVNGKTSLEPFHDFSHPEKFTALTLLEQNAGNSLYAVSDSSIARLATDMILTVPKPTNGIDFQSLQHYQQTLLHPVTMQFLSPTRIQLQATVQPHTVISLAETFDSNWHVQNKAGQVVSDSFGNIVILPTKTGDQTITLVYQQNNVQYIFSGIWIFLTAIVLFGFSHVYYPLKKRLPRLHLGLSDEDE